MERSFEDLRQQLRHDLHDLCQPLTALQCRLELAKMYEDPLLFRELVQDGLHETRRMFAGIALMRERLLSEEERKQIEGSTAGV